jgi:hypothetical protein
VIVSDRQYFEVVCEAEGGIIVAWRGRNVLRERMTNETKEGANCGGLTEGSGPSLEVKPAGAVNFLGREAAKTRPAYATPDQITRIE